MAADPSPSSSPGRAKRASFITLLACLPFVVLALIEGASSLALFANELRHDRIAADIYTEPDTLLGWINQPDFFRADFYGPHRSMRTNALRMRHDGELATWAPSGRRRVVCSGDSFTLGYGVSDAQTWCAQLGSDQSLETVNMGQGGYGLDQAYLWYLRDGLPLHPKVHLFAFVSYDIDRMLSAEFLGHPKPTLIHDGAGVRASGVPVSSSRWGRWIFRLNGALRGLRSYGMLPERMRPRPNAAAALPDSVAWTLVRATLGDLARRDRVAGVRLVVVFLPSSGDFMGTRSDQWRRWAHEAAARHEFDLVDLVEPLRRTAPAQVDRFFIKAGEIDFVGATGHYTAEGNSWVAAQLRGQVPALNSANEAGVY